MIIFLGVLLVTLVYYSPAVYFEFLGFDDYAFILKNPVLKNTPAEAFLWGLQNTVMQNWIPLVLASFSLDYTLFGFSSVGFHFTNILIHALNTALLTVVFYQFLTLTNFWKTRQVSEITTLLCCAFGAVLWGLHPLRVESVVWISSRKDVLFMFFFLCGIIFYLKYTAQNNALPAKRASWENPLYLAAYSLFFFACLAKGMAVVFPVVISLIDYTLMKKGLFHSFLSKWFWYLTSIIFSFIQIITRPDTLPSAETLSMTTRIINSLSGYGFYIEKTFFPVGLVPIYFYEAHQNTYLSYILITAIGAFFLLLFLLLRGNRFVKATVLFFVITSLPIIGIIQTWIQEYADRFSYLPTIVFYLWIPVAMIAALSRLSVKGQSHKAFWIWAGTGVLIIFCALGTSRQIWVWENTYSLWERQMETRPNPTIAMTLGNYAMSKEAYHRAVIYYTIGHQLYPENGLFLPMIRTATNLRDNPSRDKKEFLDRIFHLPKFDEDQDLTLPLKREAITYF